MLLNILFKKYYFSILLVICFSESFCSSGRWPFWKAAPWNVFEPDTLPSDSLPRPPYFHLQHRMLASVYNQTSSWSLKKSQRHECPSLLLAPIALWLDVVIIAWKKVIDCLFPCPLITPGSVQGSGEGISRFPPQLLSPYPLLFPVAAWIGAHSWLKTAAAHQY